MTNLKCSYFPTDELEQVPERPEVAAARANAMSSQPTQIGEETGLPFIGYTYTRLYAPQTPGISDIADLDIVATGSVARVVYRRWQRMCWKHEIFTIWGDTLVLFGIF
jgi:hypothetical protein